MGDAMPADTDAVAAFDAVQMRRAEIQALAAVAPGEGVLAPNADAAAGLGRGARRGSRAAGTPSEAAALAGRSARLLLRRVGRLRGRLVMTSRSGSSSSGTMRMMPRALRHPGADGETKRPADP